MKWCIIQIDICSIYRWYLIEWSIFLILLIYWTSLTYLYYIVQVFFSSSSSSSSGTFIWLVTERKKVHIYMYMYIRRICSFIIYIRHICLFIMHIYPPEKNTFSQYFQYIDTITAHFIKTNYIFWKPMEFSTTLCIYVSVYIYLLPQKIEYNEGTLMFRFPNVKFFWYKKNLFFQFFMRIKLLF